MKESLGLGEILIHIDGVTDNDHSEDTENNNEEEQKMEYEKED